MMCTHLHHDHVGWNTQQKDGKWVPTFPNARYVFNKPDIDYFSKIDADPKEGPAELGTFRECVVPILEYGKADVIAGAHRINDFIEIDTAPGHSPGHVFFKLESKGERAAFIGDVWHHLLQVYYPDWNFPKNSDAAQARVQPAQGARLLRGERRAGDARPCRRAVRRPRRKDRGRLPAGFQGLSPRHQRLQPLRRDRQARHRAGTPSASSIADAIAAPTGLAPPSPAPFRPSGLSGLGASSVTRIESSGISRAVGIR